MFDGFPQTRNAMSMGPLSHPGHPGMNGIGRPGSAGDIREGSRERRRERNNQNRVDDEETREDEVISTIFVVGFPDDMSVRVTSHTPLSDFNPKGTFFGHS